jgi:dTDP-D-glucose 4,6-dehydratase
MDGVGTFSHGRKLSRYWWGGIHRIKLHPAANRDSSAFIINLDKLTYAGNLHNLASIAGDPRYEFVQGWILATTSL